MSISERISLIMSRKKLTNKEVAEWLGVSPTRIGQKFNDDVWDSIKELTTISEMTGYSLTWIMEGFGPEQQSELVYLIESGKTTLASEDRTEYLTGKVIRPITVTVDKQGKDLITYVPVKAQAGYPKGFGDGHYIEKLPAFNLPILRDGRSYRMFEVKGDSMLQMGGGGLHDGDVIVGEYVEDIFTLRDRRVYVVIMKDGVFVKRVLNRLNDKDNPILVCQSDNKNGQNPDIIARPNQILEVWELKAFISKQLGFATDIWDMLKNVESQVALMDEKIRRIENERLSP